MYDVMCGLSDTDTSGYGRIQYAHFLERLMVLPLADWSTVAMRCPNRIAEASEQALHEALSEPTTAFDVWSARDDVETALCCFECPEGRSYISRKGSRAHIKLVTERAALGVLLREVLGETHFIACYGGFEALIPVSRL
jgi:hypothetical protein